MQTGAIRSRPSVQFLLDGGNLGSAVLGSGPTFTTQWNTTGATNASHTLSAMATDAQGRQTTSAGVVVTVANSVPTVLTTYVGAWGGVNPSYSGATVTLPVRAYNPGTGGASDIGNLTTYLVNSSGTTEFSIVMKNSSGAYSLLVYDSGTGYAPWPPLALTPNGQTTAASISLSGLQVTATRLALVGNELQLDLTLSRSGAFSDQVTLGAISSSAYSQPWTYVSAAQWSN